MNKKREVRFSLAWHEPVSNRQVAKWLQRQAALWLERWKFGQILCFATIQRKVISKSFSCPTVTFVNRVVTKSQCFCTTQTCWYIGCNSFGPKPIWSPDFRSPTSCPHGQMVPKNLVPLDKWSPTNLVPIFPNHHSLPPGQTEYSRDHFSRGTKLVGDHLSMGTKFLGTICPWGQEVGDQKSGDQIGSGPNASQPF